MVSDFSLRLQLQPADGEEDVFQWDGAPPFDNACLRLFAAYRGEVMLQLGDTVIPLSFHYDLKGVFLDLPDFLQRAAGKEEGPHYLQFATGSGLDLVAWPQSEEIDLRVEAGDGCGGKYLIYDGRSARVPRRHFVREWQGLIFDLLNLLCEREPAMADDAGCLRFRATVAALG